MKAAIYEEFRKPLSVQNVSDPAPTIQGVVLRVGACGICRSDWHGWMGHDADVKLPHVPGHEIAGTIEAVGRDVKLWKPGDRVTLPFVCGCGNCPQCVSGNHQVCDFQFQPGFTHWGAFAEFVAVDYADVNLVRLPDEIDFVTAASLGCRFITSFRAVVAQGKVSAGQWVAVHGCGGVGLSAIMIADALGANVVAIDISDDKLEFAKSVGASVVVNAANVPDAAEAVRETTGGGAHVSIDALGSPEIVFNSISCLRKRGKHIQIGLLGGENRFPEIPINKIVGSELEILGSHGMQAYKYEEMMEMIRRKKLQPDKLIGKTVSLEAATLELVNMNNFAGSGVTVINSF
jgi:alcohol dehydrogenase